ncbi:MAG: outer membrane beta-barrel protein [Rhodobacteraceae bacterium]|uniref:outer membrane protein n=1 Tax=Celeribacter sp. HF31 TaxID=2721558 RepID=UPI00142F987B|nr:outer membrane beta-barrel protein [Celeribacter sp. HF31]NIY80489.1 outer membrane beta-barrel protein [Celeribacter sp. HF31]NVK47977.1 outer membrane beta-barrel protein [Paracoccaceae bacterium]
MKVIGSKATLALVAALAMPVAAQAGEFSLSVYGGYQTAPHSDVSGTDGGTDFDFNAGWDGESTAMPPYYGIRGTWWVRDNFGWIADFNHTKVYANDETLADSGFSTLEFTDGLNNFTVGPIWRWPGLWNNFTPYASVSAGVVVPHVEVETPYSSNSTFEYQLAGPSIALVLGASYELNDRWDLFTEYKGTYSQLDVDLDGGGNLESDIITNALNFGVTYKF